MKIAHNVLPQRLYRHIVIVNFNNNYRPLSVHHVLMGIL